MKVWPLSVVNIPTRYGLQSPWFEPRWKRDFPHTSRLAPWSNQPPVQFIQDHSREIKRLWRGVNHQPLSSAEVKEKVEHKLYSPSAPSWQFVRWNSTFNWLLNTQMISNDLSKIPAGQIPPLTFWSRNFTFKFLAHPVGKMRIIQEPKKVALWNKRHFEEKKRRLCSLFKIFTTYICWINI